MKMNVFEAIATRRSIRKFTSQDVPMEILGVVIDGGRYAPSSGNIQNWRFVLVKDKENKQRVAEAAMHQLWIASAPVIIVVCAETEKLKQFYGIRGDRLYSVQNCAAAIENMLLTAHCLGLGSCWVSDFDEDMLKRALNIPGDIRPQAILPLGYPDEIVPAPTHYTMENVCYFESYGTRVSNIERVMQNPLVFDKISRLFKGLIDVGKDAIEKRKGSKK
ncbi:TPA: nitroreductase family protein [Candidatus Woesearchaeota archaeon]|nr:nitroreductase family protein [Candidatus Woesearchaeota archaeon]HIH40971.1 nitroreductase family protein [Candidatus Woesearchaeota archaeon]